MLIFVMISIVLAKSKGYSVKVIMKCFDLYPLFFLEGIYSFFVISAYFGDYSYVRYAQMIQIGFLLSMIVPLLGRSLYVEGITGATLVIAGTVLNRVVIHANHGKMPVLPTLSKLTGYYHEGTLSLGIDSLHIPMTQDTKWNLLGDYIDTGFSIMSIGDLLIHSFVIIIVYAVIKNKNKMERTYEREIWIM